MAAVPIGKIAGGLHYGQRTKLSESSDWKAFHPKMGYCVNKRTAQKEDKTVFIQKKINNKLSLIVIQEFQNSRITSPFELLDLPCMWHTLTCAYTPIKCSAPLPVARVTKPAHLQLPKSNKKLFFLLALCVAVRHWSLCLPAWLSSSSAPVHFPPFVPAKR